MLVRRVGRNLAADVASGDPGAVRLTVLSRHDRPEADSLRGMATTLPESSSSAAARGSASSGSASSSAGPRASKAVIPAAGLATRFLPATKAVPKELLPVVDRPVLQYIIEEASHSGIHDVLLVTGRGKTSMVDYLDRRPDLEMRLEAKGDLELLDEIKRITDLAEIYTCRQGEPLGLGHAVSYAESHVGGEPFAVLLGDEFMDEDDPLLPAMLDLQTETGGIVRVTGLVEKPEPAEAPSNLAVVGRYVLPNGIFDAIRRIKPGAGGEIQLTDAMALMLAEGTPVHGIVYRGTRYDTGMPLGYLQAVVQIACRRPEIGSTFRKWLEDFVGKN